MKKRITNRNLYESSDGSKTLYWEEYDETYHSIHGAKTESEHVFIQSGLNYYLNTSNTKQLSVFEMGFGTGLNTILSYLFSIKNNLHIQYETLEAFPLQKHEYECLDYSSLLKINKQIVYNFHECKWNQPNTICPNFKFTKWNTTIQEFTTNNKFDVIFYDAFAPSSQPELWTKEIFQFLYQLLNKKGILVTYCAKGQVKRDLKEVGFQVEAIPGPPRKREITRAKKL